MCYLTSRSATTTLEPQLIDELFNQVGTKRPRKEVRFIVDDAESSSSSCDSKKTEGFLSLEETEATWYNSSDIAQFKLEAKYHITGNACVLGKESRGFERYTLERAQNKLLAIRCTLLAVKKGFDEENIMMVAKKGSSWFEKCAFLQACHDYCDAHQPDMKHLVPETPKYDAPFASFMKNKRCHDGEGQRHEQELRRVRRRVQ